MKANLSFSSKKLVPFHKWCLAMGQSYHHANNLKELVSVGFPRNTELVREKEKEKMIYVFCGEQASPNPLG